MARKTIAFALVILIALMTPFMALADYKELSKGSKDSTGDWAVYSLQMKLIELGYLKGTADGAYGKGTAEAVMAFQKASGLEVTGVATVETQEVLFGVYADPTPVPEATPTPDPHAQILKTDMTETEVNIVQSYLNLWGFLVSAPDGKYGSGTSEAIKAFQEYSINDMKSYVERLEALKTPEPTPAPGEMPKIADMAVVPEVAADGVLTNAWMDFIEDAFDYHCAEVALGERGEDVRRMQNRLLTLGYVAAVADGVFGEHSEVALKYFQQRNGLEATGILDTATQEMLFTNLGLSSDRIVTKYCAMVSVTEQRVYIYEWTGNDYTKLAHTFLCSTGTVANPTILGTFQASGRNGDWYYMEDSRVWVRYAFVITGGYFFHSVLYPTKDSNPTSTSVRNLGTRASHGCIRLSVEDAKWIYDNCSNGMTVTIYED